MNPIDPEVLKGILQGIGRSHWPDKSSFLKACIRSHMQSKWHFDRLDLESDYSEIIASRIPRSSWRVWQFFEKHFDDILPGHLNTLCNLHTKKKWLLHPLIELKILQSQWREEEIDFHGLAATTGDTFKQLLYLKGMRWKLKADSVFMKNSVIIDTRIVLDPKQEQQIQAFFSHLNATASISSTPLKPILKLLYQIPWEQLKSFIAVDAETWVAMMIQVSQIEPALADHWLQQICQLMDRSMLNAFYQKFSSHSLSPTLFTNIHFERVVALLPPAYKEHLLVELSQPLHFESRAEDVLLIMKMYYPDWNEQKVNFVVKVSRQFIEHASQERLVPIWEQLVFHKVKPGTEDYLARTMEKSLPKDISYKWEPLLRETLIFKQKIYQVMGC
jgi:hypothetical protein